MGEGGRDGEGGIERIRQGEKEGGLWRYLLGGKGERGIGREG